MSDHGTFSTVLIGGQTLLIQCAQTLLERQHSIKAIVTSDPATRNWASQNQIEVWADDKALPAQIAGLKFDYLFSIVNLKICPDFLLQAPAKAAINFHDGLLPGYAGLNVTNWALLNGEAEHGVSWHEMLSDVDKGDIFIQQRFPIVPGETALTLNAKCLEAGHETFCSLVTDLEGSGLNRTHQSAEPGKFFAAAAKPSGQAVINWDQPAGAIERLINGLDFGGYPNPISCAKTRCEEQLYVTSGVKVLASASDCAPGTLLSLDESGEVTVSTATKDLMLSVMQPLTGREQTLKAGLKFDSPDVDQIAKLDSLAGQYARYERFWLNRLAGAQALDIDGLAPPPTGIQTYQQKAFPVPVQLAADPQFADQAMSVLLLCHGLFLLRLSNQQRQFLPLATSANLDHGIYAAAAPVKLGYSAQSTLIDCLQSWNNELAGLEKRGGFALDLIHRQPVLLADQQAYRQAWVDNRHPCLLSLNPEACAINGPALQLIPDPDQQSLNWHFDPAVISQTAIAALQASFEAFVSALLAGKAIASASLLSAADLALLSRLNQTSIDVSADQSIVQMFELQAAATPDAPALACLAEELSYADLNRKANQWAHYFIDAGLGVGSCAGVHLTRTEHLLPVMLGVLKSGAAYVPLDPAYPADRVAYMVADSGAALVISETDLATNGTPVVLLADGLAATAELAEDNPRVAISGADLAYLIYTSGSTGQPKGVMVEHRNVVNFFHGMDQRIERGEDKVWLAVTSISFDISVLEIFWTLCRGFKVVLQAPSNRASSSVVTRRPNAPMGFSLFFWNYVNDADVDDPDKYRLLMESAQFADNNGFEAIWTPERHFGAFGGSYPNPSVVSAALAATTKNVKIRAGSVVMPLHSPIRVAEDWSIVDNLSGGRVGISFAAGWQPNDFVIKPEGFDNAKQQMLDGMEKVRQLWRGETVSFDGPKGPVDVATRPRPIQSELPVWITTAGNPQSFINAGTMGANLLTHLLGQTVEQVGDNIAAYRKAWKDAGHPGNGHITLMLHTLVGEDEAAVRETAREPMKNYLKSAMFLVKDAAWEFPTFKKMSDETGKDLDDFFATISDDDMDGLMEFAFNRYYSTSGLFGSKERCVEMVDRLKDIGVDEIGCLIDYGLTNKDVLAHLPNLAELAQASNQTPAPTDAAVDYDAVNEQIERHQVTHMQCTPSQASMLVGDPQCHPALRQLQQFMVGGEALPPELAADLTRLCGGVVSNMYGPTETTIWSSTWQLPETLDGVSIGAPIANTSMMIVDDQRQPLPPGMVGELLIGGDGVVRGYHNRQQLTEQRFIQCDFPTSDHQRWYCTGDSARLNPDGSLECLGRTDHQIKIRGYRIELGEIESALASHPKVSGAVVLLREDTPGNAMLVGYVTFAGESVDLEELKQLAAGRLPEFMLPTHLVALEQFPQTPNGKVHRAALPPPLSSADADADAVAPAAGLESGIAEIWCELLARPSVGVTENFFDIGGHSLLAVQVLNKVRQLTERPVKMTDLFRYPTIKSLADYLESDDDNTPEAGLDRSEERAQARKASRVRRRRGR